MGTAASNQVRSRSENVSEGICSSSSAGYNLAQTANEHIDHNTTQNVVSTQSETTAHQSIHTFKSQKTSQKSEIRSLPSPSHVRKNSQEQTEDAFRNASRHVLHQKLRELELALAVSESHKLDLQDQVQALDERCSITSEQSLPAVTNISNTLHETLNAKDQHIQKLEEDLKNTKTDFQKRVLKFKKRIRGLTREVFELRQEASITQMELKAKTEHPNGPIDTTLLSASVSSNNNGMSYFEAGSGTSHTKIIVELSTQISEQEEQIATLTAEVVQKTRKIEQLKVALRESRKTASTVTVIPTSQKAETLNNNTTHKKELFSKGEKLENCNHTMQMPSFNHKRNGTYDYSKSNTNSHHKTAFEQNSTALSDSDSDWDEGPCVSQVHRHSAPVQGRERNYMSESCNENTKTTT